MIRDAQLSLDGLYRLTLLRQWGAGRMLLFVGLNPSTADALVDDPTVKRWIHFATYWGFGGFVAVNLYPFRSPSVAACKAWAADADAIEPIMRKNMAVICKRALAADAICVCWGAAAWNPAVVARGLHALRDCEPVWCFGTTASGAPKHPMARGVHRVPDDMEPVIWTA